jgi:hypothetical protein
VRCVDGVVRIWMCIGISISTSISISITVLIARLRQITRYEAWHGLAHDKWAG